MFTKISRLFMAVLLSMLVISFTFIPAQAQDTGTQPAVRALLFYSPTCPHCEKVIQEILPPILQEYGQHLKIVAINTSLPEGQDLYQAAVAFYQIPNDRLGVPTLIVNDVVMVGEAEIPVQFPGLVADGLAAGGTAWPEIPGLADVIAGVTFSAQPNGSTPTGEQGNSASSGGTSMWAKFQLDPLANSIAVAALILMVASIIWVIVSFARPLPEKDFWPKWIIPVLAILGMGVAFYLTYVETSGTEAFCGPVGDCNTVQLSPYATLFGFLHVGLLGLIGYALILIAWAVYTFGPQGLRWTSAIALWGMAFFGVLFSIYLTFLEPFVIGATCMWCISSATIITLTFLAAAGPAKRAWQEDDFDDEDFDDEDDLADDEDE